MIEALNTFDVWLTNLLSNLILYSWVKFSFFLLLVGLLGIFGWRYFWRVHRKNWYDLSFPGPNKNEDWPEVRIFMEIDPVDFCRKQKFREEVAKIYKHFEGRERFRYWRWVPKHLPLELVFLLLLAAVIYGFWKIYPKIWPFLKDLDNESLGFVVGGLSLAIGGATIFYQNRLKARAENRQAWINSLRKDLNHLIGGVPGYEAHCVTVNRAIREIYDKFHTSLELHTNPTERVHRGLMAILRIFYHIKIDLDDVPFNELGLEKFGNWDPETSKWKWGAKLVKEKNNKLALREEPEKEKREKAFNDLLSCAFRLANVMLKREWEQVKYIK